MSDDYAKPDFHPRQPVSSGGPAFPHMWLTKDAPPGMSIRDYFAGQALASCVHKSWDWFGDSNEVDAGAIAKRCYALADAMLAEREKRRG